MAAKPARPRSHPVSTRPAPSLATSGPLPPSFRVRRRGEYQHIQSKGLRVRTHAFTVIALANPLGHARCGSAVSRRVGPAVTRNRIKRIIREIFRRLAGQLPAVDLVVVAKPPAAELGRRGLEAMVAEIGPALTEAAERASKRAGDPNAG